MVIELKTPGELDAMAAAGRVVAAVLAEVRAQASVGVTLRGLDAVADTMIRDAGAVPSFPGYRPGFAALPYPAVLCTSVNDAVVHGIPTGDRLADGDLLSVDCAVHLDGWCADAAVSFQVGHGGQAEQKLIARTTDALRAGIEACLPGNRLGDVAGAIGVLGRAAGRTATGSVPTAGRCTPGTAAGRRMSSTPWRSPKTARACSPARELPYMLLFVYNQYGIFNPVPAPFEVLAEPTRRRMLDLLLERPRLVGELSDQLNLTQPGTSKHLRVLREAGLVRVRPDAQRRWYELRPEPLAEVDAWLAPYRRFWSERLDELERHLDTMPDDQTTDEETP